MGKVVTSIRITNHDDFRDFQKQRIGKDDIRAVELDNVIVDTGATMLCLSRHWIQKLGLYFLKTVKVNTAEGIAESGIYGPVVFEIQGRVARLDVMEFKHPHIEALVGQIPLEHLDFLINPMTNRLVPNPEHEGQLILDQLIISETLKFERYVG